MSAGEIEQTAVGRLEKKVAELSARLLRWQSFATRKAIDLRETRISLGHLLCVEADTEMQRMHKNSAAHKDLVAPIREKLKAWGGLYIIENVANAPLKTHVMLCGTMFGLRIAKHRYFETNFPLPLLMPPCDHRNIYDPWHGKGRTAEKMREAQGTPWIPCSGGASRKRGETGDLNNAIPPAFSEFLAMHALRVTARRNGVAHGSAGSRPQPEKQNE